MSPAVEDAMLRELREIRHAIERQTRELEALRGSQLLTRVEAARLLKKSTRVFDRMRARGEVPPGRKVGGYLRWTREELGV